MRRPQRLPTDAPDLFVTLNPAVPPARDKVLRRLTLSHPLVSQASTRAQQRLPEVQVKLHDSLAQPPLSAYDRPYSCPHLSCVLTRKVSPPTELSLT